MIIGIIHKGSGLGDQLFSYIATRVRAADLGVDFGFVGKEFFKGGFMKLGWGKENDLKYGIHPASGALLLNVPVVHKIDKPYFDPNFDFIPDGSVIDGYGAQDIRYFEHRLDEVREWLKTEPLEIPVEGYVINLRGGEYKAVLDLYLPDSYWEEARYSFLSSKCEIHTDDPLEARRIFGDENDIIRDIELNWKSLRDTKNAIISNSAFAIIPRLLKHLEDPEATTIAPKFWAGRNVGEWRRPCNFYRRFTYI